MKRRPTAAVQRTRRVMHARRRRNLIMTTPTQAPLGHPQPRGRALLNPIITPWWRRPPMRRRITCRRPKQSTYHEQARRRQGEEDESSTRIWTASVAGCSYQHAHASARPAACRRQRRRGMSVALNAGESYVINNVSPGDVPAVKVITNPHALIVHNEEPGKVVLLGTEA